MLAQGTEVLYCYCLMPLSKSKTVTTIIWKSDYLLSIIIIIIVDPSGCAIWGVVCCCLLAGVAGSNPAGARMSVVCECCVLSDTGLCVGLIPRPEESYRVLCVWVWSLCLDHGRGPLGAVAPWNLLLLLLLLLISALQPFLLKLILCFIHFVGHFVGFPSQRHCEKWEQHLDPIRIWTYGSGRHRGVFEFFMCNSIGYTNVFIATFWQRWKHATALLRGTVAIVLFTSVHGWWHDAANRRAVNART